MIYPTDDPVSYTAALRMKMRPLADSYDAGPIDFVKRSETENGSSQSLDVWGRTRFVATWSVRGTIETIAILLWFWKNNRSSDFTFFDFDYEYTTGMSAGTGDGATTLFTIPAKETSDWGVTVGGVGKDLTTHYTISAGTGAQKEDQIQFTPGNTPGAGEEIVFYRIRGRNRYTVEFAESPKKSVGATLATLTQSVREVISG